MAAHQEGKKAVITMDQAALERAPKYVKAGEREPRRVEALEGHVLKLTAACRSATIARTGG